MRLVVFEINGIMGLHYSEYCIAKGMVTHHGQINILNIALMVIIAEEKIRVENLELCPNYETT